MACGASVVWINGNVVVDRDRFNQDRKFGVSLTDGRVVFGVSGNGTGDRTICGTTDLRDGQWHHVAVQRRRSDGFLWLWVDGALQASGDGPDGDVSYPDNGVPGSFCNPGGNQPCTNSDPFLVLGAEKHDAGATFPSYRGLFDELRVSSSLRYLVAFQRPRAPFFADAATLALIHLDEGSGATAYDTSGRAGAAHGDIRRASPALAPTWSTDAPFTVGPVTASIRLVQLAGGRTSPVDIVAAPGEASRLFLVEQPGRIRILRDGLVVPVAFLDITAKTTGGGESGLLGLAFHPNYAANRRFFVYYTRQSDGALIVERCERAIAGTPATGTQGVYAQSVSAGNGTLPGAAQTLTVLVVDACGGSADVATTDGHCNAVEWMRSRAVTIGCVGNLYCPSLAVIRASMALFQQRLGGVLSPALGYTEAAGGALALTALEIVCASADLPAASHPRDVEVRYALSTKATGALTLGVSAVASRNGGATWELATQTRMRAQTAGAQWRSTSGVALASIAAGEAVRFALALDREAGAASLGATHCRLVTMAVNRNSTAPPRDTGTVLPP